MPDHTGVRTWLVDSIAGFCRGKENTLQNGTGEPAWGRPVVGFARGDDPLFTVFKEAVGSYHWTPHQIYSLAFPGHKVEPEELTVVSWALPQTERTKLDHRKEKVWPAERWVRSRIYGEEFINTLRQYVVALLKERGYRGVAPLLHPAWQTEASERFFISSRWSERHVAHAAGLGTFGLCEGLITPLGKAVRLGSVVAKIQVEPTPRIYKGYQDWCLFYAKGTCGACIRRCPADAISKTDHDKRKCGDYTTVKVPPYVEEKFGFSGYGCGLCQVGVPCESKIPV